MASPAVMSVVSSIVYVLQKLLFVIYNLPFFGYFFDLFTLSVFALVRFGNGVNIASGTQECERPKELLRLYEYEGCPFCKKVRETLSVLDLDAMIISCPRENMNSFGFQQESRYRAEAKEIGGKIQFPLLVDPNANGVTLYESDKINEYLWTRYGAKATPTLSYKLCDNRPAMLLLAMASGLRVLPEQGLLRIPSRAAQKPLELWSFEPSPFCKKVREVMSSLEMKYIVRNVPRYAALGDRDELFGKRKEFYEKYGSMLSEWRKKANLVQVPLLVDPNTDTVLLESEDIKQYLLKTYALEGGEGGEVKVNGGEAVKEE